MGGFRIVCWVLPMLASVATAAPVVNEFVPRPAGEEGEWMEIQNPGPETLDLAGWAIRDGTGKARAILGGPPIPSGGYLLLASRPESLRVAYALSDTIPILRPQGWPVLNDRDARRGEPADVIVLLDPSGMAVDSVAYFEAWLPPEAGRSLERVDAGSPGYAAGTWGWSVDVSRATPGTANSLSAVREVGDRGAWIGPESVSPGKRPALFRYRMPAPGTMAISLVDAGGRILKVLQSPRPTGSVGQWVWGSGTYLPAHPGDYYLCLLWQGTSGDPIRRCRRVWVSR